MYDKVKTVSSQELSKKAKGFWIKAINAIEDRNHEVAVNLLQEILKEFPGFIEGRKAARKCALNCKGIRKSGQEEDRFGFVDGESGFPPSKIRSIMTSSPHDALWMLEAELAKDPSSPVLNNLMFEASMSLGLLDGAMFALETVRKAKRADKAHLYKLAELYMEKDMPKEAKAVYSEIITMDPTDSMAYKGSKVASSRWAMMKAEQIQSGTYKANRAQEDPLLQIGLPELKKWTREQLRDHLAKLMDVYQQDNRDLLVVRKLGELYAEMGHYSDAYVFYEWAATLDPEDLFYANQTKRMKKRMEDKRFKSLEQKAEANPEDQKLQKDYVKELQKRESKLIEDLKVQVAENPLNHSLRYKLAFALVSFGDYPSAIPHLQKTAQEKSFRVQSLQLLAKTFTFKGVFDLAIKQLNAALDELEIMDDQKKEMLYEKGLVYEKMQRQNRSLNAFKLIYEADPSYRDVKSRVCSTNDDHTYLAS